MQRQQRHGNGNGPTAIPNTAADQPSAGRVAAMVVLALFAVVALARRRRSAIC